MWPHRESPGTAFHDERFHSVLRYEGEYFDRDRREMGKTSKRISPGDDFIARRRLLNGRISSAPRESRWSEERTEGSETS